MTLYAKELRKINRRWSVSTLAGSAEDWEQFAIMNRDTSDRAFDVADAISSARDKMFNPTYDARLAEAEFVANLIAVMASYKAEQQAEVARQIARAELAKREKELRQRLAKEKAEREAQELRRERAMERFEERRRNDRTAWESGSCRRC